MKSVSSKKDKKKKKGAATPRHITVKPLTVVGDSTPSAWKYTHWVGEAFPEACLCQLVPMSPWADDFQSSADF